MDPHDQRAPAKDTLDLVIPKPIPVRSLIGRALARHGRDSV